MHSNKKVITLMVMFSLFIATLFLIPENQGKTVANADSQSVQIANNQPTNNNQNNQNNEDAVKAAKKAKKLAAKRAKARAKRAKKRAIRKMKRRRARSAERSAKAWIANRESGGSYTARNGSCYGKYQLLISYYHGNLSHKNQERTANRYVHSRYGSWVKAKAFWMAHNWY